MFQHNTATPNDLEKTHIMQTVSSTTQKTHTMMVSRPNAIYAIQIKHSTRLLSSEMIFSYISLSLLLYTIHIVHAHLAPDKMKIKSWKEGNTVFLGVKRVN